MPIYDPREFEQSNWHADFDFGRVRACEDQITKGFLSELSSSILSDNKARTYPDLATFGYFCRRANINKILSDFSDIGYRFGWGTVVHIAPSNIAINFAFSLVMGLLSGNVNIVRLPTKFYEQIAILVSLVDQILAQPHYQSLSRQIIFVQTYRRSSKLYQLIARAHGLVVWGGDATVSEFKALPKRPNCVEVYFPNRMSSAALDAANYLAACDFDKERLARAFYNDSYLVDQNACSSPSVIFWVGDQSTIKRSKAAFWSWLGKLLDVQYRLDPAARIDKILDVMRISANYGSSISINRAHNDIWLLNESDFKFETLRYGTFLEIDVVDISEIPKQLRNNEQTLTIFGLCAQDILKLQVLSGNMTDRIVPIGQALNIGMHWDGKDMISVLSRKVEIR